MSGSRTGESTSRSLRIRFGGTVYHVMNRGDRREPIVREDRDRQRFFETLEEACARTDWQVHALCLMRNDFQLVVETPEANLVDGMKWVLGTSRSGSTAGTDSPATCSPAATGRWSWTRNRPATSGPIANTYT